MEIKRDNPKRREAFNARHNCKTAKDKLSARYWSCKQWTAGRKVDESHMSKFPYFDYYGGSGKIYDEFKPEEHWMMISSEPDGITIDGAVTDAEVVNVVDTDLNKGVTVDVDQFAEKLAGAIADVFEQFFGDSFDPSEMSKQQLTHCVESALFEKRF